MNGAALTCPACNARELLQVRVNVGLIHACKACGGKLVGLGLLQKISNPTLMGSIWREARKSGLATGRICPVCSRALFHARVTGATATTDLDLCEECMHFWFDREELERLPRATPAEIKERSEPVTRNINPPPPQAPLNFTDPENDCTDGLYCTNRWHRHGLNGPGDLGLFVAVVIQSAIE